MAESDRRPLLYVGLHGTDDPTLATMPFLLATGAAAAEIDCRIALLGEATYLVKPGAIEAIRGIGFPPLADLAAKARDLGVPVYV